MSARLILILAATVTVLASAVGIAYRGGAFEPQPCVARTNQ